MLTKSSWDPGRLTSARKVTARDQLPREDTGHTCSALLLCTQETEQLGWGGDMTHTWGECAPQVPGSLSCLDLGRAQNAGSTESVPLWSTREPEPQQLMHGKCMQPRAHFRQFPWILSSVDWESTHAMSHVAQALQALPIHTSDISLQCSSLPTAQMNK